jgi:hypothetical protein
MLYTASSSCFAPVMMLLLLLLPLTCPCHGPAAQSEQRQPGYDISTYAAVCLLRGRAFEALENRQRAIACYTAALQ